MSEPGDHKTIATLGPSLTTVPAVIAESLDTHITLSVVPNTGYVFAESDNPFEPIPPC